MKKGFVYRMTLAAFTAMETTFPETKKRLTGLLGAAETVGNRINKAKDPDPADIANLKRLKKSIAIEETALKQWGEDGIKNPHRVREVCNELNRVGMLRAPVVGVEIIGTNMRHVEVEG